jgi:hypothetical protein
VGRDDVYLEISPLEENYQDLVNILVCRNVTQIPSEDTNNSKHSDNLLKSLRKYYAEVKDQKPVKSQCTSRISSSKYDSEEFSGIYASTLYKIQKFRLCP